MSFSSFIRSTSLDGIEKVRVDDVSPLDRFDALYEDIASLGGSAVAQLFCEPLISESNGTAPTTISWYAAYEGEAVPLTALDTTQKAAAEALLRARIDALQPVIASATNGHLIAAALYVVDAADVFVIAGEPVLTNWGLMPSGAQSSLTKQKAAFAAGLGAFGLMLSAPPLAAQDFAGWRNTLPGPAKSAVAESDPPSADASSSTDEAPLAGAAVVAPIAVGHGLPWYRRAWAPALFAVLFAALVLIVLLIPGVLLAPPPTAVAALDDEARLLEDSNRALEERLDQLRRAAEAGVCTAQGNFEAELPPATIPGTAVPNGQTAPAGDNPSAPGASEDEGATQGNLLPPPLEDLRVPATEQSAGDPSTLLDLVDLSTVLVLVPGAESGSVGTGFFVTPNLIVTNDHVIAGGADGTIYVTSETLGEVVSVELVARTGTSDDTKVDFALLRGDFGPDQTNYQISEEANRLSHVVAAGFPMVVLSEDARFRQLVEAGDASAAPSASTTRGVVTSVQSQAEDGTSVIAHDAEINQGNSGGPLLDVCGRVIGVNTYLLRNEATSAVARFALHSAELRSFLEAHDVPAQYASGPCNPTVSSPQPTPVAVEDVPAAPANPAPAPSEEAEPASDEEASVAPADADPAVTPSDEAAPAPEVVAETSPAPAPAAQEPVAVPSSRVVGSQEAGLPDGVVGDTGLVPE